MSSSVFGQVENLYNLGLYSNYVQLYPFISNSSSLTDLESINLEYFQVIT